MKIAMVISQTIPELVFNAFRLANFSRKEKDDGNVFLLAEGVELDGTNNPKCDVRNRQSSELCPLSTMKDLHSLIRNADRVVTF